MLRSTSVELIVLVTCGSVYVHFSTSWEAVHAIFFMICSLFSALVREEIGFILVYYGGIVERESMILEGYVIC